ncbi:MAG TPA: DUF4350 domain-containing protein [Dongiaceae bacterium]|jgi:hypothetical protein
MAADTKKSWLQSLRGTSAGPFQAVTLLILVVIGVLSFFGATYLQVFGEDSDEPWTIGANSFSRSAIGHYAFVETLRRLGIPVTVSRFDTLSKVGPNDLLLMIEPRIDDKMVAELRNTPHALLVLPKWEGQLDLQKPTWISRMEPISGSTVEDLLKNVVGGGAIYRDGGTVTQDAPRFHGMLQLDDPQYFAAGNESDLHVLIRTQEGILLGEDNRGTGDLWILSDPDLLSNFGIHQADNGVIAVSIVQTMLPKGGRVIIDETSHGFEQRPNLLRTMIRPPFLAVTITALVALALLIWAGAIRFGAPRAEMEALAAGKLTLVRNAGKLLRIGSMPHELLQSYCRLVIADMIAELHGPAGLDEKAQAAWIDRATRHRKTTQRLVPLTERIAADIAALRVNAHQALHLAIELHRWKQEILNGTGLDTRRR